MDWDDTRVFLAAARSGSLLGAAAALDCSHSTVRRRLDAMESALGVTLFTAGPGGLSLTDAARAALPLAEAAETAIAGLADRLRGETRALTGRLMVTTVEGALPLLADAFAQFRQEFPGIELILDTDHRSLSLTRREADVAIRFSRTPDPSLFGRRLGALDYAVFARGDLAATKSPEEHPFILWEERLGAEETEAWFARWRPGAAPAFRVTSAAAMLELAKQGLGAALLPVPLGEAVGLTALGAPVDGVSGEVWCLTHPSLRHSGAVRGFMQAVAASRAFRPRKQA